MVEKAILQEAFKRTCDASAQLYVILLAGRSDKAAAFHIFVGAFLNLYLLTINHAKLREFKTSDGAKLTETIQDWFNSAKTYKNAARGMELFEEFNIALGQVGLL